jgi:hypothetical protein
MLKTTINTLNFKCSVAYLPELSFEFRLSAFGNKHPEERLVENIPARRRSA